MSNKGMTIPMFGTVFILISVAFFAILAFYSGSMEGQIIQKGGKDISLSNQAEFWIKSFDESLEIIARRTAYDLGKIGGVRGYSTYYWTTEYPRIPDLEKSYDAELKNSLPLVVKGDIEVRWSYPYTYTKILWNLPGDCDLDGNVDNDDINNLTATMNSKPGDINWNSNCDFDWDERINAGDSATLGANLGRSGGRLQDEKNFFFVGYVNYSVYSSFIDTKISLNRKINHTVNSSYFRLLYVGRKILEDSNYRSLINDATALQTKLQTDFPDLAFTITDSGTYIDVLITYDSNNPISNCLFNKEYYCVAPLKKEEHGMFYRSKRIPYDLLKLNFRIVKGITSLLMDDFNDGNDNGWTRVKGTWSAVGGLYQQDDIYTHPNTLDYLSVAGDFAWQNYVLEADARNLENDSVSLVLRYTQNLTVPLRGEFYRVILEPSDPYDTSTRMALIQYANGWDGSWVPHPGINGWETLNSTSFSYDPYIWKHMKAEVRGPNIKFWINGNLLLTASDSRLTNGKIGILSNTRAQFDNINVTEIP